METLLSTVFVVKGTEIVARYEGKDSRNIWKCAVHYARMENSAETGGGFPGFWDNHYGPAYLIGEYRVLGQDGLLQLIAF